MTFLAGEYGVCALLMVLFTISAPAAPSPAQAEFFEKNIRPVLAAECYECHSSAKKKGGLALDTRDGLLRGGESGPALVPGQPDSSLLTQALRHTHPTLKMPKNGAKLDARVLANFAEWIRQGAPDPRVGPPPAASPASHSSWADTLAFRRQWWSFQPLTQPSVPTPKNAAWSTNAIDRFLLAKMESHGLAPGPDADPRTFIRRLTFTLTGLPPKPDAVEEFVREYSQPFGLLPGIGRGPIRISREENQRIVLHRVIDSLLSSPAFAERWARHWLDLVRYAETHGSEGDPEIPLAWQYRDYVIRALDADVPADQLIREHIAGDLLPAERTRIHQVHNLNESRLGTAHFRLVEHGFQPVDTLDDQVKAVDSQIDVLSKAFQGLTTSCARCHDHKFDPISQRDYTALYGVLASVRPAQVQLDSPEILNQHRAELLALKAQIKSVLADSWRDAIPQLLAQLTRGSSADPQLAALHQRAAEVEKSLAALEADARAKALAARAGGLQALPAVTGTPANTNSQIGNSQTSTLSPSPQPSPAGRGSQFDRTPPRPALTNSVTAPSNPNAAERLSLSQRERAGVRENGSAITSALRSADASGTPQPISRWSFDTDTRDQLGSLHGELLGTATLRNGRLVLDGKEAHLRTAPLARELREKTLEAWLTLATLDQSGGGVFTVETSNGAVFDSIVFAEKEPGKWVNGSDFFRRSRNLDGPVETAATNELIHVAVSYRADGTVAFFRNGQPFGTPHRPDAPLATFPADARVLLGRRHTGGGRAFLAGEIDEARLYDRALSAEEIAASFRAGPAGVSSEEIAKAMTPEQKTKHAALTADLQKLRVELATKSPATGDALATALKDAQGNIANPLHAWAKLGQLSGPAFTTGWADVTKSWRDALGAAQAHNAQFKTEWDLAGADAAKWFTDGNAFGRDVLPRVLPADFALEPDGDRIFKGLLPAAISSHLVSEKHGGLLTSPRFRITTDNISVRAAGGKGAMVRLIVDNYPLGVNPVFPKAELNRDEPGWLRLDTAYRKGNWAYLEFATADDLTRKLGKGSDAGGRSWFSAGRVVFHDREALREEPLAPAALLERGRAPADAAALAALYSDALTAAVQAWREGNLSDSQHAFLDAFVRRGLLPTSLKALPKAAPLVAEYRRLESEIPVPRRAPGVIEGTAFDSPFLPRGDHLRPGESVPRGYLEVLRVGDDVRSLKLPQTPDPRPQTQPSQRLLTSSPTDGSGRLRLAHTIASPQNPLTARVMVNRVWHHLFGRGLVPTVDNFGRLGDQPTHPELLDHLAAQFIADGWSFKKLIRHLVTTRAYQLASEPTAAARERDADNAYLSHFRVRRLEAEAIRDTLLAVSGRLDATQFGPPVGLGDRARRSIYLNVRRNNLSPFLEIFDAPKPFTTLGRRDATNVPAQSLALLNDPFVIESAKVWAEHLLRAAPQADAPTRIQLLFQSAFARFATADELAKSRAYLTSLGADANPNDPRTWQDFIQSLFNLKEFIYVR